MATITTTIQEHEEKLTYLYGKKALMNMIGTEAEIEVGLKLARVFGHRNVSHGVDGFSTGTNGYPDLSLNFDGDLFFIEVKSIIPFFKRNLESGTMHRANAVKVNRDSWLRIKQRARTKIATILVIVEIRLNGKNDYFLIDYDHVESLVNAATAKDWVHIPLHYLLLKCRKLEFKEHEFMPNPIDTSQSVIN